MFTWLEVFVLNGERVLEKPKSNQFRQESTMTFGLVQLQNGLLQKIVFIINGIGSGITVMETLGTKALIN